MGHLRLGRLPRTQQWKEVIALLSVESDASQVAETTLRAAESGFNKLADDAGFRYVVWLLTQLPIAAREDDFAAALRRRGLRVSERPDLLDIVGALTEAVDKRLRDSRARTDLSDIAQRAAGHTLQQVLGRESSLFGESSETVQFRLARFATATQFGHVARVFFAHLSARFLDYHLSRELSNHVGRGQRFATSRDLERFRKALARHCWEAARIVESFSGGWLSKTRFQQGQVSADGSARFAAYALTKLRNEFARGSGNRA